MMSEKYQVRYRLKAGESVMFDNHRVLHARTEFTDPERFLQICNVPREPFHERLRNLARKLGSSVESEMILCAGV
jgi:gamma-butyrobetaine dioxygenase